MTRTTPVPAGSLSFLILVSACSGEPAATAGATTSDSAGVVIVTNQEHDWGERAPWRLSAEPTLSIGEVEGSDEYQFYRVASAVRRGDGSIVVANGGNQQLRFYDPDGMFVMAAGGEGSGPGEFAQISLMQRYRGDSLFVVDAMANRFSVFSAAGDFGRSGKVDPDPDQPLALVFGTVADGGLLVQAMNPLSAEGAGVTRTPQYLYAHDPEGGGGVLLGEFPGFEFYRGGGPMSFGAVPFGRMTVVTGYGNDVLVGSTDTYELRILSTDGSLLRIIRLDHPSRPVEAAHIDQNKEERRERLAGVPEMFRQAQGDLIDEIPFPQSFPAFQAFRTDTQGNLWVEDYRIPGSTGARYRVFDPDGVLLGPVEFPESFTALDIGADYVLGRYVDDVEVEYVRLFQLIK